MQFPRMLLVRQHFPDRAIKNIPAAVEAEFSRADLGARLQPGARIAIGVGSRGIANIDVIARAAVAYWKARGMKPFIFPAMGSHGAATAEGQAKVLAHYGITESSVGCPVVSQLEVVSLGHTDDGIEAFMDRKAFESDGVILLSRVKWHTDFDAPIESGMFKMMAIGLGKFAGAKKYHTHAYKMGLGQVVRTVGRQVLRSGKILGGLAILEDARHATAKLEAVPADGMEKREEELLALVKSWAGRIPVKALDLLILDEMGKNISGTGMDTKIVNRTIRGIYNPWPNAPRIERIFTRDLTDLSYGNGVGLGMLDVVHDRLLAKVDWTPTYINSLTASTVTGVRTPMHFSTDRECIERIAPTVGKFDTGEITIGWIRNSMQLDLLALSENLLGEIRENSSLEIAGKPFDLPFGPGGDLASPLAPAAAGH